MTTAGTIAGEIDLSFLHIVRAELIRVSPVTGGIVLTSLTRSYGNIKNAASFKPHIYICILWRWVHGTICLQVMVLLDKTKQPSGILRK